MHTNGTITWVRAGVNSPGYTLSRNGDAFQFLFPTPSMPSTPCGWQISVPYTTATAGLFVTLQFSSFAIPCPGGKLQSQALGTVCLPSLSRVALTHGVGGGVASVLLVCRLCGFGSTTRSAVVIRNGTAARPGPIVWQLCGDAPPLATPPMFQIPSSGTPGLCPPVGVVMPATSAIAGCSTIKEFNRCAGECMCQ